MANYNEEMYGLGSKRSVIRELFEFGRRKREREGEDAVFDFSLGNPSVPPPGGVPLALSTCTARPSIHGYTSAQGDAEVRRLVAESLVRRFGAPVGPDDLYMTCGAAASLCICLKALRCPQDEFIVFAPFFPEYRVFIEAAGGKVVTVPFTEPDFQIDFEAFAQALSPHTKAVIINSPNNPSGVIYTEETLRRLTALLEESSSRFGHPVYLISDEPYRELYYTPAPPPFVMNFYRNTLLCYSWSKSLSLPGERIGYIAVHPQAEDARGLYAAICGAGRALGYVCAPSLFQRVAALNADTAPEIEAYRRNRDLLYGALTKIGYECAPPDGAFYLFVKSLESSAQAFSDKAKEYGLLIVPGDDFAAPGYVRLAYCVDYDMIRRAIPFFERLYADYR